MAQLIEPDGTLGLTMTIAAAVAYCASHPGWTWQEVPDDE